MYAEIGLSAAAWHDGSGGRGERGAGGPINPPAKLAGGFIVLAGRMAQFSKGGGRLTSCARGGGRMRWRRELAGLGAWICGGGGV